MFLLLLQVAIAAAVAWVLITQVLLPALDKTPLFPAWHQKAPKVEEEILGAHLASDQKQAEKYLASLKKNLEDGEGGPVVSDPGASPSKKI